MVRRLIAYARRAEHALDRPRSAATPSRIAVLALLTVVSCTSGTTADPSPAETIRPSGPAVPSPSGPCSGVAVIAPADIQQAVDAHPPGTTFCVSGHFRLAEPIIPKDEQSFVGPAVLEGVAGNDTGITARFVADGVEVDGLEMFGFELRAVEPGDFSVVRNCDIHHNLRNGIGAGNTVGVLIEGNVIHHNGSPAEVGAGAAGIKMAASGDRGRGSGTIVRDNHVYANVGNGIWFDVDSGSDHVEGNTVEGNGRRGIFYEVSRGPARIAGNTVTGNNTDDLHGASGIGISSSKDVTIDGNVATGNRRWGIRANAIDRGYPLANVVIRDNVVDDDPIYGCAESGVECVGNRP